MTRKKVFIFMLKYIAINKMKVEMMGVNLGHVRSGRNISRPKRFEN